MARIKLIKISIQRPWIPYIILVSALIITGAVTYYVNNSTREQDGLRFMNTVEQTQSTINSELEIYTALLRGTSALFAEDSDVTSADFEAYINRLFLQERYRGIQGIGFIERVPANQKDAFVQMMTNQMQSNFIIHPDANRSEYNLVLYLEPKKTMSQSGIGFDMGSDPTRYADLMRARDTGLPSISQRTILKKTGTQTSQPGFFIFVPVYRGGGVPGTTEERRQELLGYIFSPFRANNLFNTFFDPSSTSSVIFNIYDGHTADEKKLLHTSANTNDSKLKNYKPTFQFTRHLTIDGETWTIIYSNDPNFDQASQRNLPPFIFLGGMFISFMFFMLSRSQYIARTNAEIFANQLQTSQLELQKAIGLRDNFISIASHELKTPVTSLKVYAEVLINQFTKKGEKQTTDYLVRMNRQIDKLTLLIHDLLDVSRLQAGHLTFRIENFDLNALVHEVVDNTQQLAHNHRIIIEGKASKRVWGDKDRIGQVLNNLLTNAMKYSPKAKKIVVKLHGEKGEAGVTVKDFGIGISKEHQKKIFNRFYRVNDTNEQTYPGLGMGLYICNEIMKYHGGQITIESKRGKGSLFGFNLPYSKNRISKSA